MGMGGHGDTRSSRGVVAKTVAMRNVSMVSVDVVVVVVVLVGVQESCAPS
jgi:hypothetical protein